jgi:peroxiredoxin
MSSSRTLFILVYSSVLTLGPGTRGYGQNGGPASNEPRVARTPEEICPLKVGSHIPDVDVATINGMPTNLRDLVQSKPTALVFYRGGWCPHCNRQLAQLHEVEPELLQMGYQIVAVSADRPSKLRESLEKHSVEFILLSDSSMVASRMFGIAFTMTPEKVAKYRKYDMDLEAAAGEKHHMLPVPAVFIVGTDGVVKFSYVNANHQVRLDPDVLLVAAMSALE